jgi:hypothetical protein
MNGPSMCLQSVHSGLLPVLHPGVSEKLYQEIVQCLHVDSSRRPTASDLLQIVRQEKLTRAREADSTAAPNVSVLFPENLGKPDEVSRCSLSSVSSRSGKVP